jgi:hypothetical protein
LLILYGALLESKARKSSRQFVLSLPGGIVVQVRERVRQSWDDTIYDYELSHVTKPIASLFQWNGPMQFSTGALDGAAYLNARKLLSIYREGVWTTWVLSVERLVLTLRSGEMNFGDAPKRFIPLQGEWANCASSVSCGIRGLTREGDSWVLTLERPLHVDPSGHVDALRFVSRDFGANWSAYEPAS